MVVFKSCFGSSLFVGFDFFGVRDWPLGLLGFRVGGEERPRVREGRDWCVMGFGRGRRGGCCCCCCRYDWLKSGAEDG